MSKEPLLLVERDAKTRRLLKVSLEQAGYVVTSARDGADALKKLELTGFALVLSATDLPKLDGYALVRRMKDHSEWAQIPVVFMTSGGSLEDKIRGMELGVEEFIQKPVFVRELLSRVHVLLAKRVRRNLSESAANTRIQGSLGDLPPVDLLESLENGAQSGIVSIARGGRRAQVFFHDGEIIDARLKKLRGEEVIFRILGWTEGTFEVELIDITMPRIVDAGTRALIESGMRHAAEVNRLRAQLPDTNVVLRVRRQALQQRMGRIPEALNGMLALLDGERTLEEVVDDSPFDDLSTLQTVAKLYGEGFVEVTQDAAIDRGPESEGASSWEGDDLDDADEEPRSEPSRELPPTRRARPSDPGSDGAASAEVGLAPSASRLDAPAQHESTREAPASQAAVSLDDLKRTRIGHTVPMDAIKPSGPTHDISRHEALERLEGATNQILRSIDGEEAVESEPPTVARGELAEGAAAEARGRADRAPNTPRAGGAELIREAGAEEPPSTPGGHAAPDAAPDATTSPESIRPDTSDVDGAFSERPDALDRDDAPESDAPESDAPESDAPESDAPESDAPESDAPESDAPESDAPESDAPESDAPESDAPESDAPRDDSHHDASLDHDAASDREPESGNRPRSERSGDDELEAAATPPRAVASETTRPRRTRRAKGKRGRSRVSRAPVTRAPVSPAPVTPTPVSVSPPPVTPTPPSAAKKAPPSERSPESDRLSTSQAFFASADESHTSESLFPESEKDVVYLTPAQIERRRSTTRIVGVVVGVLAALAIIIIIRSFTGSSPKPMASNSPSSSPPPPPSASVTSTASAPAPAPVPPPADPSAVPSGAADAGAGGAPPGDLPDVEDPYKELFGLVNAGANEKAIPFGYAAIKKDPENGDAYYLLGEALRGLGKIDEAKKVFKACVDTATKGQYRIYCKQYAQ